MSGAPSVESLSAAITGRSRSMFADDVAARADALHTAIAGKRLLVVGGAGSIGSATARLLASYAPAALHIADISENYLADLARDLRNSGLDLSGIDLRFLPLDFGGPIMRRFIADEPAYDAALNFAALKHVRSEKDVYSLLQMIDTNVVRQARFKAALNARGDCPRYFAVSTDKAANPTSLMGASKRLMEDVLFDAHRQAGQVTASARFANVAFSNGSLPQAFMRRLALGEPLAAPRDTRRYFISMREAGEICLLAALLGEEGLIYFPNMDPATELRALQDVATTVLGAYGFKVEPFESESEAVAALPALARDKRWPLILTPLDTSGEKPYEEFVGRGEVEASTPFAMLRAVRHAATNALETGLLDRLASLVEDDQSAVTKAEIVAGVAAALDSFSHVETGKSLDQRV